MIGNITLGQYFPGQSPLHKLDPRAKILLTVALIVVVFLGRSYLDYALLYAFVLGAALLSRIDLKYMAKGLKPIFLIIVLTFVLNVFFAAGGNVIFQWGFLRVTDEGLKMAVLMALRLALLVFGTQLLTLTTSPIALTDGLESLMRPLSKIGFPAHELAMMMSIALRFIPTLIEETDKIMNAQKARGADFESGNILKKAKAMVPILVPLFISAFRRADELAVAMECRCYHGGKGRTRMKQFKLAGRDFVDSIICLIFAAATITISRFGW
mgnify:CR=1 FL=1